MISVRYIVADVGAAIDFYREHLGFEVEMNPGPGFASLTRGELRLLLNAPSGPGGAAQPMPDGRVPEPGGWNRIQLEVADLAAEVERLEGAGANLRNEIVSGRGGDQILLEDPSGNPIKLFQPPIDVRRAPERVGELCRRRGAEVRVEFRRAKLVAGVLGVMLAIGVPAAAGGEPRDPAKVPTAKGTGGAASTVDALATKAAIKTLRKGGNAVDAAVAAAGVLGVTEPFSSGIGGGGFMVIRTPGGRVKTIDGRETAPAAMAPDSFFENGAPLAFNDARYSGLSAGIPGTVATWDEALDRYGTRSMRKALNPGIRVARRGFVVDQTFFDQTAGNVAYFDDVPSTAGIYLDPDGTPRDVGTRLRNRDMARAYERIARRGPAGFYGGPIAEAMVEAAQDPPTAPDADHVWRPGLMTAGDLAEYEALWRKPTRIGYRGLDVWGMGPPSSGGSTVGESLNILEGYEPLGADRPEALHRFLEASRYSFADRGAYLADPAFFDVPLGGLLSDSFAAERRSLFITDQAADAGPVGPGDPTGNEADPGSGPSTRRASRRPI